MSTPPADADAAQTGSPRHDSADLLFGTAPDEWLHEPARLLPPKDRMLKLADGERRNCVRLARQGFEVVAFDVDDPSVDNARAFAQREVVWSKFAVADCDGFAWPEAACHRVDAIFVQFADPAMRARLFGRIVRRMEPCGVLVLQDLTTKQPAYRTSGPSAHRTFCSQPLARQ